MEISIIMPLYNAEKYLGECLDSVLKQTFRDFELICVNDASTDATMQIICDYQEKDSRIKILSNDRRCGAAFSRNRGMNEAKGMYLAFLDGDDIFDETMLEKAYDKIEEKGADIVMYEFRHVQSEHIHNKLHIRHSGEYINKYCKDTFSAADCEAYEFIIWASGPWNKLYRKEFIEENQLAFQDLPCANDIYFVNMALLLADKLIMLETGTVMVYVRNHSEVERISNDRNPMCNYMALMQIKQELMKRKKLEKLCSCFYYRVYLSLQNALLVDKNKERVKEFYQFLQKEGIWSICPPDEKHYNTVEQYVQKELKQFVEKSFDSGWYKERNILTLFLDKKADKVIALYERCRANGRRVAIWGAGEHGEILLKFCLQYKLSVEAIIDKAEDKQGSTLYGYTVAMPQEVLDKIQVIVISARFIYDDVAKEVKNKNIEIIDINQFLCLY